MSFGEKLGEAFGDAVIQVIRFGVPIFVLLAVSWLGLVIYNIFNPKVDFSALNSSKIQSVEKSDLVTTSLAHMDLMWVRVKGSNTLYELTTFQDQPSLLKPVLDKSEQRDSFDPTKDAQNPKLNGYCLYSLQVTFGAPSQQNVEKINIGTADAPLSADVIVADFAKNIGPMQVLAINPESIEGAPNSMIKECVSLNARPYDNIEGSEISEAILYSLAKDGLLSVHQESYIHSMLKLVSFRGAIDDLNFCPEEAVDSEDNEFVKRQLANQQCLFAAWERKSNGSKRVEQIGDIVRDPLAMTPAIFGAGPGDDTKSLETLLDPPAQEIDPQRAYFTVTISNIMAVSAAYKPLLWFNKTGFHIQKDISSYVYGTDALPNVKIVDPLFGRARVVWDYPEPSIVAEDRRTAFAYTANPSVFDKEKVKDKIETEGSLINFVDKRIRASSEAALNSIHDKMIRNTQNAIISNARAIAPSDVDVEINFSSTNANDGLVTVDDIVEAAQRIGGAVETQ